MSSLITVRAEKEKAINVIFDTIRGLAFHGMSQDAIAKVFKQYTAMYNDSRDLDVQVTFGASANQSKLVIETRFNERVKQ